MPRARIKLRSQGHNQVAAHNQRLLICQRQDLARTQRFVAHAQTCSSHQGIHYNINVIGLNQVQNRLETKTATFGHTCAARQVIAANRAVLNAKFLRLSSQNTRTTAHSQRSNFQLICMLATHIKRLRSNRARRS